MSKICNSCDKEKYDIEFRKLKNDRGYKYLDSKCKRCRNKKTANGNVNRFRKNKVILVNILGGKCKFCGYKKCLRALDIDHINPNTKTYHIKDVLARDSKMKVFLSEVSNFQLLCANCHREKHCVDNSHHL